MNKHVKKVINFPIDHPYIFAGIMGAAAVTANVIRYKRNTTTIHTSGALRDYGITTVLQDKNTTQLMVDNFSKPGTDSGYTIPLKDLGVFGERISELPGVDPNQNAWVLVDILRK